MLFRYRRGTEHSHMVSYIQLPYKHQWNTTWAFARKLDIFTCENNMFYYIHTEKHSQKSYVVNFRSQISSSPSEERTMVFTREKNDTSNRNRERCFSRVRKMIRPIKSHRGVWVSRQNSRLFLQLAGPLRTHSMRTVLLKEFFSLKSEKHFGNGVE